MKRCIKCVIPDTRPDTEFVDGVCSACLSYEKRPQIDWEQRKIELLELLDRHDGKCIVPSSGGKDSHYQVLTLLDMGADVTVVTATTCHLTSVGRKNIDNLSRYARTIEITPNKTVRAKLNRFGLSLVGDISWPEHISIHRVPFRIAVDLKIPLIFYGENPLNQYGSPSGLDEARQMTQRWVSEFGGFLGLRPQDLINMDGIKERDMQDYLAPCDKDLGKAGVAAYFLGQFIPWDSHENAKKAKQAGMICQLPTIANYWEFENLDNAQTGIHDNLMYRKYGYGRLAAQVSVDIRSGILEREQGLNYVLIRDGIFPWTYMHVQLPEILDRIEMKEEDFWMYMDKFTNHDLFRIDENKRLMLKECLSPTA